MSLTKTQALVVGAVLSVGALTIVGLFWAYHERPVVYPIQKRIQYRLEIKNQTSKALKHVELLLYAPANLIATQNTKLINTSHTKTINSDKLGNQVLQFYLDLAPNGTKFITIDVDVAMASVPNAVELHDPAPFLREEPFIETQAPELRALANQLQGDDDEMTIKNIYQWVSDNIASQKYVREDRGAQHALRQRQGDCTEFMYLTVALARINKIPARGIGGYVLKTNGRLQPTAYHNWAQVFVDGSWRLLDAQKRVFRERGSDYIAMRVLSNKQQTLMENTHQFLITGKGLHVKMY